MRQQRAGESIFDPGRPPGNPDLTCLAVRRPIAFRAEGTAVAKAESVGFAPTTGR